MSPKVAVGFKLQLERAEKLVIRSPNSWPAYHHGTRGFRFRRYPFVMAYVVRDGRVLVVAVAHTRQHPDYWRNRLSD